MLKYWSFLLAALLASSCTSVSTVSSTTTSTSVPMPSTSSTSMTMVAATTTLGATTTTLTLPALGLVSATGVPLAIVADDGVEYLVTTPCGNTATLSKGTPITSVDVVIDPGHGGPVDTGAVAPTGMPEKALNLEVARLAKSLLAERGIAAVLTRTGDYSSLLSVRANLADTLGAAALVSIHHNAPTPGPSFLPGVEVFIQNESDASARLGGLLWESGMAGLGVFDVAWVAADDAGVMTVLNTRGDDAYGIIRAPSTPTALVELGYISSRPEAELHQDPNYAVVAAGTVADAIELFLTTDDAGSGFVEGRVFNPSPGIGKEVCVDPPLD